MNRSDTTTRKSEIQGIRMHFQVCPEKIKKGGMQISLLRIMNGNDIVNLILVAYFVLAAITGYKRGILSRGQWMLGIVFGFLAVPVVSPLIELLLRETQFVHMLQEKDASVVTGLSIYLIRVLIFSLSLVIVKGMVYHFTDFDLPKGAKVIDRAAGALFSVLEACFLICFFDWITGNSSLHIIISCREKLLSSEVYAIITKSNPIYYFLPKMI